jgi:hypothetical protein
MSAAAPHQLRRLVHDVKNQLYVINMGLEVLRGARDNPEEISRLIASIRTDGLEPLKTTVAQLIEAASAPRSASSAGDTVAVK